MKKDKAFVLHLQDLATESFFKKTKNCESVSNVVEWVKKGVNNLLLELEKTVDY